MEKLVTELVHADLGKNVVVEEANGDRNSGKLVSILLHAGWVQMKIDNAHVTAALDAKVTLDG